MGNVGQVAGVELEVLVLGLGYLVEGHLGFAHLGALGLEDLIAVLTFVLGMDHLVPLVEGVHILMEARVGLLPSAVRCAIDVDPLDAARVEPRLFPCQQFVLGIQLGAIAHGLVPLCSLEVKREALPEGGVQFLLLFRFDIAPFGAG